MYSIVKWWRCFTRVPTCVFLTARMVVSMNALWTYAVPDREFSAYFLAKIWFVKECVTNKCQSWERITSLHLQRSQPSKQRRMVGQFPFIQAWVILKLRGFLSTKVKQGMELFKWVNPGSRSITPNISSGFLFCASFSLEKLLILFWPCPMFPDLH